MASDQRCNVAVILTKAAGWKPGQTVYVESYGDLNKILIVTTNTATLVNTIPNTIDKYGNIRLSKTMLQYAFLGDKKTLQAVCLSDTDYIVIL